MPYLRLGGTGVTQQQHVDVTTQPVGGRGVLLLAATRWGVFGWITHQYHQRLPPTIMSCTQKLA